jgi:hypothetical protein
MIVHQCIFVLDPYRALMHGYLNKGTRPEVETMTHSQKIAAFKKALGTMSNSRAGWDYEMSREQRAKENAEEKEAVASARSIWAENPDMHDDLRAAFKEAQPLATMNEIENLPIKAAPEVRRTHSA